MSRRGFVSSSGTYNVRASEQAREKKSKVIRCIVFFLDDSQHTFEIEKRAKGQLLLDTVCQHLELVEKDYFGLQYSDLSPPPDSLRWLDANKSVRKQVKTGPPYLFYFRVKFYVSDPSKLHEEYTRYHFFLQVKKDILEGRLVVPSATAVLLASYAVQSEFGDYSPDDSPHNFFSELRLVPNQTPDLEKKILELYKLHKGQTPAGAEYNYLDHAKRLDMYGLDLHRAKDSTNADIQIGVASTGLVIFQNNIKINTFSWAKIVTISFKRKHFYIQLRREGTEEYDNLVGFNLLSYRSCKSLWKSCVEHHTFFRLHTPRPPPRRLFFSLGSKFRYSGRTEYQTQEEGKRKAKPERIFASTFRSPSKRYLRQPTATKESTMTKVNGAAHVRPLDTHKIQVSEAHHPPKQAWTETPTSEITAFVPSIPSKLLNYMDEELTMANGHEENLTVIKMKADENGKFGFNVKGGADQNLPILVSRVAPNTPADTCVPRLNEGDQVLLINGRDVTGLDHDQVVKLIRAARDTLQGELMLTVRPNVYVAEEVEEPDFQYIPDVPHVSSQSHDALDESMMLLSEALESGAAITQFEQLYRKKPGASMNICKKPENLNKNRYRDISPYDNTRVVLSGMSDYINANHVNMEIPKSGIVNRYIATQGPLANTVADFWQMVWEQQSTLIVMVTTLLEKGRVKCHKYWPDYGTGNVGEYGSLRVVCVDLHETSSFVFREFVITHRSSGDSIATDEEDNNVVEEGEERHVSHMQYLAWPDHGVPDDASDFLTFVNRVRQARVGMVEPTVVHCSAGIGRTGVLILMETAMCLIEANEPVYPLDIVRQMRDQRAMLIQTASQYRFVCEAILRVYNEKWVKPLDEYQR